MTIDIQELEQLRRTALLEISEISFESNEIEILQTGLAWVEDLTNSSISFLHFINDDQETIELVTWSKRTLETYCHVEKMETHYPITQAGVWAEAFRTKDVVTINHYESYEAKKGLPQGHASLSRFISHPILEGDQVRVLLGVGNKAEDYNQDDLDTVRILADYLWRIVSRKRIQSQLDQEVLARIELEKILDRSPAVIFLWKNIEGFPVEYVSKNVKDWGYSPEELISGAQSYQSIIDPRDVVATENEVIAFLNQKKNSFTQEYRIVKPDGTVRWIDDRTWIRRNDKGEITHLEGICLDITDRKEVERQLLQAQKTEALGNLAGGVAHDFNNMLLPIMALADITKIQIKDDPKIVQRMEKIMEAGTNAQSLVKRLMAFSRAEDVGFYTLDLIQSVQETLLLLKDTMPATMTLHFTPPPYETLRVHGNGAQLKSVLINIVKNAADAYNGKIGTLEIRLSKEVPFSLAISKIEELDQSKHYILVTMKDEGPGMAEEVLNRIFDPFFTTKSVGEGTGMGLAMCHSIIRQHGGIIYALSEVGKGTTFKFFLPCLEEDAHV